MMALGELKIYIPLSRARGSVNVVSYIYFLYWRLAVARLQYKNNQSAMKDCHPCVCARRVLRVCIWPRRRETIFIMLSVYTWAEMAVEEIECLNTQAFRKRFIFLLLHWIYCHNLLAADQVVFGQLNIYLCVPSQSLIERYKMSNNLSEGDLQGLKKKLNGAQYAIKKIICILRTYFLWIFKMLLISHIKYCMRGQTR